MFDLIKQFCNIRGSVYDDAITINMNATIENLKSQGIKQRYEEDDDYNNYCSLVASYVKPKVIDNYTLAQNVIDHREEVTNRFILKDAIAGDSND